MVVAVWHMVIVYEMGEKKRSNSERVVNSGKVISSNAKGNSKT